jgi:hypothetical protein
MHRLRFTPHEYFWYSLLLESVNPGATVPLEGLDKLKISYESFGNLTCDLPACSTVPQPSDDDNDSRSNVFTYRTITVITGVGIERMTVCAKVQFNVC